MSSKEGIVDAYAAEANTAKPYKRQKWYHLFGEDVSHVPVDAGYSTGSETSSLDENTVDNHHNVFAAPEATDIYKLVDGFEGTHRFEPSATWEAQEEKQLVRRVRPSPITFFLMISANSDTSLTGSLRFPPVSCSLLSSLIVAISLRRFRITCSVSSRPTKHMLDALIALRGPRTQYK